MSEHREYEEERGREKGVKDTDVSQAVTAPVVLRLIWVSKSSAFEGFVNWTTYGCSGVLVLSFEHHQPLSILYQLGH